MLSTANLNPCDGRAAAATNSFCGSLAIDLYTSFSKAAPREAMENPPPAHGHVDRPGRFVYRLDLKAAGPPFSAARIAVAWGLNLGGFLAARGVAIFLLPGAAHV
mmetsp:Transcript_58037/g.168400  ORF Transcript_58037/g.168400 Transcript_58037/m.168400 type:complete len:105 (+) Transcript_58037:134-448(+)